MTNEIRALISEAKSAPYGSERIALLEQAVARADQQSDDRLGFEARMQLVEAAVFGGYPEKGLLAFSWCAAKCKADPNRFPESKAVAGMFVAEVDLLWAYKWMTLQIPSYPQLSRPQIMSTLDEMEDRYRAHSVSLRPVYMQRARAAIELGDDRNLAREWFQKWQSAPRDLYADCPACEVNFRVQVHLALDEPEIALATAEPLLGGEIGCQEVPEVTYGMILETAQRLAPQRAPHFHEAGYALIRDNRDFVATVAEHANWCLSVGRTANAKDMIERHFSWAENNRMLDRKLRFFTAARNVYRALGEPDSDSVPAAIPATTAREAAQYFDNASRRIAARFDERNGNDYISRQLG